MGRIEYEPALLPASSAAAGLSAAGFRAGRARVRGGPAGRMRQFLQAVPEARGGEAPAGREATEGSTGRGARDAPGGRARGTCREATLLARPPHVSGDGGR